MLVQIYQVSGEYFDKTRVYMESSKMFLKRKINQPESQCRMVLIVVSMALLLDNMLYMVIVPIVPYYLAWLKFSSSPNHTLVLQKYLALENRTKKEPDWLITDHNSREIGALFAFKAIVQLLINPLSGAVIDRIGYDIPMMIGLLIIFVSTTAFAFGQTLHTMFFARGLQGVGSAFADTAGLAMIADRFTEESSRTKALGIALAFISFGSLVAPPFGGIMYQYFGKEAPFFCLAFVALVDGFLLMLIMKPVRLERRELQAEGSLPKGTPIQKLLIDPYIAICAGCLTVANVSLAFLEPTITNWMLQWKPIPTKTEIGLIWLPSFFPHVAGVYTTVKLASKYPQYQWLMAAVGLALEGIACAFVPACSNFMTLMIPLCVLCYGIALVDTAILPTLGYLVDTRHVSVYGSIYAIADISYSLAYAIGPIVAGSIVEGLGFVGLNIVVFIITIAYVPILYLLRNVYQGGLNKLVGDGQIEADSVAADGTEIIKPGRKRSYLMNGTGLDAKNVGNINAPDFNSTDKNQPNEIMESDALISNNNNVNNNYHVSRQVQSNAQSYNAVSMTNPIQDQTPVSSNTNFSSDNIRRNQYGY